MFQIKKRFLAVAFVVRKWFRSNPLVVRRAVYGAGLALAISVVLQLVYPANRTLPFAHVAGRSISSQSTDSAAKALEAYYVKPSLKLKTDSETITKSLSEIGIEIDTKATARAAAKYPLWQRFIPFSAFGKGIFEQTKTVAHFDSERVAYFAKTVHDGTFVAAKDAGVTVRDGQAILVPSSPSQSYTEEAITNALHRISFANQTILHLQPIVTPAKRGDKQVKTVLSDAQKIINTPLVLVLPNEKIAVSKNAIGEWLDFAEDTSTKKLVVSASTDAVTRYLVTIQPKIDKAPGKVTVSLLDGGEISRSGNAAGQGLDTVKATHMIQTLLNDHTGGSVTLPIISIPAAITYSRAYSNTQAGLNALLKDIVAAKGNYAISVIELDGQERSASANGSKQFTSASTYKLPVAYAVFRAIAAGQMSWLDPIYGGKNADACFEAMIVQSDNNCARAFGDKLGWSTVQARTYEIGMHSTIEVPNGFLTTANDLALFMKKLYNGTLVSNADRDRLLSAMKRQIYRSGIPAGTGVIVADKVGFIDGYLHDVGIVYGSKGTYAIAIMSNGSTWANVADSAWQVHQFLSR